MSAIQAVFRGFLPPGGLPSGVLDKNDALRLRVWQFVRQGIPKRAIAKLFGGHESTFNRWLANQPGIKPATVIAEERFNGFVAGVRQATEFDPYRLSPDDLDRALAEMAGAIAAQRSKRKARRRVKPRAGKKLATN